MHHDPDILFAELLATCLGDGEVSPALGREPNEAETFVDLVLYRERVVAVLLSRSGRPSGAELRLVLPQPRICCCSDCCRPCRCHCWTGCRSKKKSAPTVPAASWWRDEVLQRHQMMT